VHQTLQCGPPRPRRLWAERCVAMHCDSAAGAGHGTALIFFWWPGLVLNSRGCYRITRLLHSLEASRRSIQQHASCCVVWCPHSLTFDLLHGLCPPLISSRIKKCNERQRPRKDKLHRLALISSFLLVRCVCLSLKAFPLTVHVEPTVREEDGLAMSSRNARLTPVQRLAA
jgi:hypothetical protein